jgi:hypothetical protein
MTADKTKFIEWAMLILGAGLAFTGWRTIRKHYTMTEGREYKGKAASAWVGCGLSWASSSSWPLSWIFLY